MYEFVYAEHHLLIIPCSWCTSLSLDGQRLNVLACSQCVPRCRATGLMSLRRKQFRDQALLQAVSFGTRKVRRVESC